jgi:hypothetical protein
MLTAWDFEWMDRNQQQRTTRTAQVLLDEVSYPIMMHQVIGDRSRRSDPLVNGLFIPQKELRAVVAAATVAAPSSSHSARMRQQLLRRFAIVAEMSKPRNSKACQEIRTQASETAKAWSAGGDDDVLTLIRIHSSPDATMLVPPARER